jgi:hypothetical protein
MHQSFPNSDDDKRYDNECDKGFSEFERGLKEATDKYCVEASENQQHKAQIDKICRHKRVAPVDVRVCQYTHANYGYCSCDQEIEKLNKHAEGIFGSYRIGLFDGQEHGVEYIVVLAPELIALEDAEAYEKGAAEDRISGQECN